MAVINKLCPSKSIYSLSVLKKTKRHPKSSSFVPVMKEVYFTIKNVFSSNSRLEYSKGSTCQFLNLFIKIRNILWNFAHFSIIPMDLIPLFTNKKLVMSEFPQLLMPRSIFQLQVFWFFQFIVSHKRKSMNIDNKYFNGKTSNAI